MSETLCSKPSDCAWWQPITVPIGDPILLAVSVGRIPGALGGFELCLGPMTITDPTFVGRELYLCWIASDGSALESSPQLKITITN